MALAPAAESVIGRGGTCTPKGHPAAICYPYFGYWLVGDRVARVPACTRRVKGCPVGYESPKTPSYSRAISGKALLGASGLVTPLKRADPLPVPGPVQRIPRRAILYIKWCVGEWNQSNG